ncbi:MAG: glycosyltransferase family 2 protein [Acidobacteriota bacterium]
MSSSPDRRVIDPKQVAVVIPCHDEELTVGKVVRDFCAALPGSQVIVVDNASRDRSAEEAARAGARIIREVRPGKGFALIAGLREARAGSAEYFVIVDGDDTYEAGEASKLLTAAAEGASMVIGTRLAGADAGAFRLGHSLGNRLFIGLVRLLFGIRTEDLFSGYRVISRQFLESTPLIAQGFEVEAELSLQAAVRRFPVAEVPVSYRARPKESPSKLNTYRDGFRILFAILTFFRDYKPLTLFGLLALALFVLSLGCGGVVLADYLRMGSVSNLLMAVLAAALFMLAALSLACGVLLTTINRRAAEISARLPLG